MTGGAGDSDWNGDSDEGAGRRSVLRFGSGSQPSAPLRAELVGGLRDAVRNGTYVVDYRAVAVRMLPVLFSRGISA